MSLYRSAQVTSLYKPMFVFHKSQEERPWLAILDPFCAWKDCVSSRGAMRVVRALRLGASRLTDVPPTAVKSYLPATQFSMFCIFLYSSALLSNPGYHLVPKICGSIGDGLRCGAFEI